VKVDGVSRSGRHERKKTPNPAVRQKEKGGGPASLKGRDFVIRPTVSVSSRKTSLLLEKEPSGRWGFQRRKVSYVKRADPIATDPVKEPAIRPGEKTRDQVELRPRGEGRSL